MSDYQGPSDCHPGFEVFLGIAIGAALLWLEFCRGLL